MAIDGERIAWVHEVQEYLYARLGVSFSAAAQPNLAMLAGFVAAVRRGAKADLEHLFWLFHLLRPSGGLDFVEQHLSSGVRTPTHARVLINAVEHRGVRGRVDWPRTVRQRTVTSQPAILVLRARQRSYDTPENRLLVAYVRTLRDNMAILRSTGEGFLAGRLSQNIAACEQVLKSAPFRDLPAGAVTNAMLAGSRKAKQSLYRHAAELWDEYEAVCGMGDLARVRTLLRTGWLEPTSADDLFELFVLVKVLRALEARLVDGDLSRVTYGLVRKGARAVAHIDGPEWQADVWFNLSPHEALQDSFPETQYTYKDLLGLYDGLSGAARRPDVLVLLTSKAGERRVLLIEAKNARASDEYGRDSLYKVLGYLKDFEQLWSPAERPKALLVYRTGSKPKPGADWLHQDLAIFSAEHLDVSLPSLIAEIVPANLPPTT